MGKPGKYILDIDADRSSSAPNERDAVKNDGTLAASAATKVRAEGIVAGLEMADKFLSLTNDRKEVASMIRAAILAAKEWV